MCIALNDLCAAVHAHVCVPRGNLNCLNLITGKTKIPHIFGVEGVGSEGVREADLRAQSAKDHCLYQASSRGGGYNLTRFWSPGPVLV